MKKLLLAAVAALALTGCSAPDKATKVLSDQGYTAVEITGWRMFGCSDDDDFTTGFRAKTAAGHEVTGVVCSSWGLFSKGATIRLD